MTQEKINLKTHEIISLNEAELVAQIRLMSLEELEYHAREIMIDMGSQNYSEIMSIIMKALQDESQQNISKFETVQKTLENALPNKAYLSDIYARLAAIVMSIIARRFQALL